VPGAGATLPSPWLPLLSPWAGGKLATAALPLLEANREGVCGVPGFLAISLAGVAVGALVLDARRVSPAAWRGTGLRGGAIACGAAWALYAAAHTALGVPSRRLADAPYVAWVVAVCCSVLWSLLLVDLLTCQPAVGESSKPAPRSRLLEAISSHFLEVFCVANLLTGAVNAAVDTIAMPTVPAMLVLSLYTCCVCGAALALGDARGKRGSKG